MKIKYLFIILILVGVSMNAAATKKEWFGEHGYCNCLLVTMARLHINEIDINSNSTVPNLEELSKSKPATYEWIKAQEFNFTNINSAKVIEILCESAEMKTSLLGKKSGVINVHDVEKENGPIIQRKYYLAISNSKGANILKIRLENK